MTEQKQSRRDAQDVRYRPTLAAFKALGRPVPDLPRYRPTAPAAKARP